MRVALTGGFGSGKSTVATMLKRKGATVIDADAIVHELYEDRKVKRRIERVFGSSDKKVLARAIFDDPRKRRKLEAILHPEVRKEIRRRVRGGAKEKVFVIDIPLLFESGWKEKFDAVVVVTAAAEKRVKRLMARGFTAAEAKRRMRAQLPLATKVRLADYVIDNNGTIQQSRAQTNELWKRLTNRGNAVRGKNGLAGTQNAG